MGEFLKVSSQRRFAFMVHSEIASEVKRSAAICCGEVTIMMGDNPQQIATSTYGGLAMTVRIVPPGFCSGLRPRKALGLLQACPLKRHFNPNPPPLKNPTALNPVLSSFQLPSQMRKQEYLNLWAFWFPYLQI